MRDPKLLKAQDLILSAKNIPSAGNPFGEKFDKEFSLRFENPFTKISARFASIDGDPSVMFLRTFYYSAENEVMTLVSIQDARDYYRKLLQAGFTEKQ